MLLTNDWPRPADQRVENGQSRVQGYDRDSATERKQRGDDKLWQFMVRVRIPGGRLTTDQYLVLDDLADRYGNGSLRVTTRQSIQFHSVLKPELKATIAAINQALLTT